MNHTTFLIVYSKDSEDRLENLRDVTDWLSNAGATITTKELPTDRPFHRTKAFNDLAMEATTPVIVLADADCIIDPIENLRLAEEEIISGMADFVWPFSSPNHSVPRSVQKEFLSGRRDIPEIKQIGCISPLGGMVFCESGRTGGLYQNMGVVEMITFCMPFYPDGPDRIKNLAAQESWLKKLGYQYRIKEIGLYEGLVHRTKTLNELAREATTEFIAIHDLDVIFHPGQYEEAIRILESNEADFVWPYDGTFWRVGPDPSDLFRSNFYVESLRHTTKKELSIHAVGGSIFVNRRKYLEIGGENEHFIGYGPEDTERRHRMMAFGRCARVPGPLYHLHHPMGKQSSAHHRTNINLNECYKVQGMNAEHLRAYIKTWEWAK